MAIADHPSVLEALEDEDYISLTTYRKNGNAVPTPVWFVLMDDKIYAKTLDTAGKVKRIRNNEHVTLAACNVRGVIHSDHYNARATLYPKETAVAQKVEKALSDKYGFLKWMIDLFHRIRGRTFIAIEIVPE